MRLIVESPRTDAESAALAIPNTAESTIGSAATARNDSFCVFCHVAGVCFESTSVCWEVRPQLWHRTPHLPHVHCVCTSLRPLGRTVHVPMNTPWQRIARLMPRATFPW